MSLRYDVNFNRRALEARERLKWLQLLRTVGFSAYFGALVVLVVLYALLVNTRHNEVRNLPRVSVQHSPTVKSAPILVPPALEAIRAGKASPQIWAMRLRRLAQSLPADGALDELEGGADTKDLGEPRRGGSLMLSGSIPVGRESASPMQPLTAWLEALQADTTFHRGFKEIRIESSRMVTSPNHRAVEFRVVAD